VGEIIRVNLSDLKVKVEEMPKEYQGLGGKGKGKISNMFGWDLFSEKR
jgi:hypothetical protein